LITTLIQLSLLRCYLNIFYLILELSKFATTLEREVNKMVL